MLNHPAVDSSLKISNGSFHNFGPVLWNRHPSRLRHAGHHSTAATYEFCIFDRSTPPIPFLQIIITFALPFVLNLQQAFHLNFSLTDISRGIDHSWSFHPLIFTSFIHALFQLVSFSWVSNVTFWMLINRFHSTLLFNQLISVFHIINLIHILPRAK